jgi:hypothetical protein
MKSTTDTAEIKALEQRLIDGIKAKDVKQIMSCYSDEVFAYDVVPQPGRDGLPCQGSNVGRVVVQDGGETVGACIPTECRMP